VHNLLLKLELTFKGNIYPHITFVGHSLGGIVAKQLLSSMFRVTIRCLTFSRAINTAYENPRFNELFLASRTIMVIGTPHRESNIAKTVVNLVAVINASCVSWFVILCRPNQDRSFESAGTRFSHSRFYR
jgi:hypothetical protein